MEKYEEGKLVSKLMSDYVKWDSTINKWMVRNYYIRELDGYREHIVSGARLDTTLAIHPSDFKRRLNFMETMNIRDLTEYIEQLKMLGESNVKAYQIEKHKRYAFPFSAFILTLIGVSVSSRKVKGEAKLLKVALPCQCDFTGEAPRYRIIAPRFDAPILPSFLVEDKTYFDLVIPSSYPGIIPIQPRIHKKDRNYEDLKENPIGFLKKIYSFLDVDRNFIPSLLHQKLNASSTKLGKLSPLYFMYLTMKKVKLYRFAKFVDHINAKEPPKMRDKTRQQLRQVFAKQVEMLENHMGRELSLWK